MEAANTESSSRSSALDYIDNRTGWTLASLILIALALFNWMESRRVVDTAAIVVHAHEAETRIVRLFSLVQDVESSQRGFLITGDASMLARYETAKRKIEQELKEGQNFAWSSLEQERRSNELKRLITQRVEFAASVLQTAQRSGMPAAQQEIMTGGGLALMDSIRSVVGDIREREQSFLTERTQAARRSAAVISVAVPTGFSVALLGLAFAFTVCRKVNRELSVRVDRKTIELRTSLDSLRAEIRERQAAEESLRRSEGDLRKARDELEQRVTERTTELQRSNEELEQFAYVASHDLQEPLRAISGCVQIIQNRYDAKLDAKGHELIAHTVSGVARMKELIDGLLAYSRVNRVRSTAEPVSSDAAFKTAVQQLESAVAESGAKIACGELPAVVADRVQLVQLFQNLLGNALKYRGQAAPEIEVSATRSGDMWDFAVRDNGIGIEQQYFQRVFAIFQRLHTRDEFPGTGIGLALCKKIVERAGGLIWIESKPGAGSTFHFTLPQAR